MHSAAFRLLAMDVADEAILVQERLVGPQRMMPAKPDEQMFAFFST
jgi:hypothetical protein